MRTNLGLEIRYLIQRQRAGHALGARRANIPPNLSLVPSALISFGQKIFFGAFSTSKNSAPLGGGAGGWTHPLTS